MNKNLMPEVAELLGVELEESFAIKTEKSIFRACITTSGLHVNYDSIIQPDRNNLLCGLLQGLYTIQRPSWEPEKGDRYYYPNVFFKDVMSATWSDNDLQALALKKLRMVYKTKEEAEANLSKDYEKLTGKKLHENA